MLKTLAGVNPLSSINLSRNDLGKRRARFKVKNGAQRGGVFIYGARHLCRFDVVLQIRVEEG
jgi:hypothetical protein